MYQALLVFAALIPLTGCATIDRGLYDASSALAPAHPIYGTPVFNVIQQEREVAPAQQQWAGLAAEAQREGVAVDPPGGRTDRLRSVFDRLVAVAHRPQLPWQVHLVDEPEVNAFTWGGGMVVVWDGLFGGMVSPDDDDELAAVLAHEIAHVTLLHVPTSQTWVGLGSLVMKEVRNEYYQAAYSTEQEAEADRISVLYMALAGYDPMAASRVWERAHRRSGSSAGKSGYLHGHPLDAERMAATREAASRVQLYRMPGRQNPDWDNILNNNSLYVRVEEQPYQTGTGLVRAVGAAADTWVKHDKAKQEQKHRERMASAHQAIQIVRTWEQPTADGHMGVFFDVHNGTDTTVSELAVDLHYLSGQQLLGTDNSCRLAVNIPPGQTARLGCYKRVVSGSTGVSPQVVDVRWR